MGSSASVNTPAGPQLDMHDLDSPLVTDDLKEGFNILTQMPSSRIAFAKFVKNGDWITKLTQAMKVNGSDCLS